MNSFMKRVAAFLLFFVLTIGMLAGPWEPSAQAAAAYKAHVTAGAATIHTGPGKKYHSVAKLHRNASVTVTGTRGSWKKISYGGKARYIYGKYIKKTAPSFSFRSYKAYVKSYSLVMRSKASSHYRKVRTLYMNSKVTVIGAKGSYSHILYAGRKGYVQNKWLKSKVTSYSAYLSVGSANLWKTRGKSRIGSLHQNDVAKVTGSSKGYLKVAVNGVKGYAWHGYFQNGTPPQASAPAPAPPAQPAQPAPAPVQTAYQPTLSLRAQKFNPYSAYVIVNSQNVALLTNGTYLGTLKKNDSIRVIGETGKNLIIDYNGQSGLIPASSALKGNGSSTDGNGSVPPRSNTSINGIDISHYQNDRGAIDFNAIKNSGISFVIEKATEGNSYIDPNFSEGSNNYSNSINAGLNTYAYHFLDDPQNYSNEANNFIQELQKVNYPKNDYVFVDVEINSGKLDPTTFTNDVDAFLNILNQNGYTKFGIYTGYSFYYDNFISQNLPTDALIWIARYGTVNDPNSNGPKLPADIWQFGKDSISGISGPVDVDIWYVDNSSSY